MELCPYEIYCPDGGGSPPLGGTKAGDKWSPMSDGTNRWVQVGTWGGNAVNTCLGHHEIAGGVHGNNRLGGNSLLDCVVFGRVAGKADLKH